MTTNERLAVLQLCAAVEDLNKSVIRLSWQGRLAHTSAVDAMCRRTRELLAAAEGATAQEGESNAND